MDDVKVVLLINNIILIGQLIEMDLEPRCMLLNSYLVNYKQDLTDIHLSLYPPLSEFNDLMLDSRNVLTIYKPCTELINEYRKYYKENTEGMVINEYTQEYNEQEDFKVD